jgi:hypothetical protein
METIIKKRTKPHYRLEPSTSILLLIVSNNWHCVQIVDGKPFGLSVMTPSQTDNWDAYFKHLQSIPV